jgi:hypothetical protein
VVAHSVGEASPGAAAEGEAAAAGSAPQTLRLRST